MKLQDITRRYPFLLWFVTVTGVVCVLFVASLFYIGRLQSTLESEIRDALEEVARQGVKILQTQIRGDENALKSIASAISEFRSFEEDRMMRLLQREAQNNSFKRMAYIRPNGFAVLSDGLVLDASKQSTFLRGMEGEASLSQRYQDGTDGKEIIVQAVPVFKDNKVMAVLTSTRDVDLYAEVLSVYSFGGMGYNVILQANGNRVVNARHPMAVKSLENVFKNRDDVIWQTEHSPVDIQRGMEEGKTFSTMFTTRKGGLLYASFVPVGINDWYMVSLVPEKILHAKTARLLMLTLLFSVLGVGLVSLLLYYILAVRKSSQAELHRLAYEDPLTGFPNWAAQAPKAQALLQSRPDQPYAMVTLDVDRFKVIANIYGETVANKLLVRIAQILAENTHEGEEFSRMESDRFQMLLKYESEGQMRNRLQLINEEILNVKTPEAERFRLLLSFGVYVITDRKMPVADMIGRSFLARRTVKYSVDVVAFFDEELLKQTNFEKKLEDGMEDAFSRGEFKIGLLPIKDLATGKTVRASARVYWTHPQFGVLPGYKFRPVFERNGFARRIDRFVLEELLKLIARLRAEGRAEAPLSMVLSPLHMYNPYFASWLKKMADQYQVPSQSLELDVMQEKEEHSARELISLALRLCEEGFVLGVHRFGEGFSAMEFLSQVKVSYIKIWMPSFLSGRDPARAHVMLETFTQLAALLKTELEVNGVETEEQLGWLKAASVRYASGPLWGEPLSPDEFIGSLQ